MKMFCVALVLVLAGTLAGCGNVRRSRRPPPEKLKAPEEIEIDWNDPGSVVEGFFDAKKRGNWRKAFKCCDFKERLGAKEAKKIRKEWRKEARSWPTMYDGHKWFIVDATIRGELALVSVRHLRWVGPGIHDSKNTGFDELLKRYGDRWKISDFVVTPE